MKRKLGSLFVGAGAVALALLGIPAATATAGAAPMSTSASHYQTFTVTPTGATVTMVGTTHFTPTETATGTHAGTAGAQPLPANLSKVPLPKVPDVGKGASLAGTGTARGAASKGVARGHLSSAVPQNVTTSSTATSVVGINAYGQGVLHPTGAHPTSLPGVDIEPPDQGLCANGTYTMEVNNEVMQVWQGSTALSANGMALEKLFTTPEIFGATGSAGINVQGDPRCQWDPTSGHWFASQIWLTESGNTSPFGWSGAFVAVSMTTNPAGTWTVYFVPDMNNLMGATTCNNTPVTTLPFITTGGKANPCFGDQPLLGINNNTVFISTNEYSLYSTTLLGAANVYFMNKTDLINGTPSPIYWSHPGTSVQPFTANVPLGTRHHVWYSIVPAVSDGTYPATSVYAMSNVTFTTIGGSKVAEWTFSTTGNVAAGTTPIMATVTVATTESYSEPPNAVQKAGTTPLGTLWNKFQPKGAHGRKLAKENVLATNTDRITTAAYDPSTGAIWGAMNTGVTVGGTPEAGIAWFMMTPTATGVSTVGSGYVSVGGADVMYPSIAFTNSGAGLMAFGMSGSTMYPSTGYAMVTGMTGPTATIHVSFVGKGPADGFSEYTYGYHRPRWGDYSMAVASGTSFSFATEVIAQTCSVPMFVHTFTCGGTRDLLANWATSVNTLSMS